MSWLGDLCETKIGKRRSLDEIRKDAGGVPWRVRSRGANECDSVDAIGAGNYWELFEDSAGIGCDLALAFEPR